MSPIFLLLIGPNLNGLGTRERANVDITAPCGLVSHGYRLAQSHLQLRG
ncbi:hypothetical protein ACQR3P_21905 [Rhodococcus sp. IEGM1300]